MMNDTSRELSSIRRFINTELLYREDQEIDPTVNLIESGVIDSMALLRLTSFLEEYYDMEIPDEDIVADNFRSLGSMEAFVAGHMRKVQPSKRNDT